MKNKGFTLVELLAVIVILAVIGIITIPLIGNVIKDSKKKALETSVYGLVEAADYFTISNDGVYGFLFNETSKGETKDGEYSLDYKGEINAEGELYIDSNGDVSLCLENEDYYVYKNYNSGIYVGNISEDSCTVKFDPFTNKYIAYLESEGEGINVYTKEEVNTLIDGLETKINQNGAGINTLTSVINSNKSEIENIKSSLSNYALQSELDKTNSNVSSINTKLDTNTNNIATLQTSLGNYALNSDLDSLSSIVSSNQSNINELKQMFIDDNSNEFSYASGSITPTYLTDNTLTTLNISSGRYVLFGYVTANIDRDSLVNSQVVVSGNVGFYLPNGTKTTMRAGGGVTSVSFVDCVDSCVAKLSTYGYLNEQYTLTGNIVAVKLH